MWLFQVIDMTKVFRSGEQIITGGNLTLHIFILFAENGAANPYFWFFGSYLTKLTTKKNCKYPILLGSFLAIVICENHFYFDIWIYSFSEAFYKIMFKNLTYFEFFDKLIGQVIYTGFLGTNNATDHTAMKAPVLVWSLKLTMARLG